ncbi:sodium-dependent transporter bedraggled isoform X2 [Prorops nasuta]|uniref:sodium-dependent transporter bedraggled isoform X2 n=1 Tax=Prorops nasuta TaxID=863751 RepID=UPI0034CDE332
MATKEDGDLIDLANEICVPRVSLTDVTSEEQEHLLDVCPPKLEQKLSLTRRQENSLSNNENGNVLVTLGHDQVVPIRKRIDVVSSDTIKRVRDITRKLEPVIRRPGRSNRIFRTQSVPNSQLPQVLDVVDSPSTLEERDNDDGESKEGNFAAKEINNAFNFLNKLDGDEEDEYNNDGGSTEGDFAAREISNAFNFLTELDGDEEDGCRNVSTSGRPLIDCAEVRELTGYDMEVDNPAFEASPVSSKEQNFQSLRDSGRTSVKRRSRDEVFLREPKRRSFQTNDRKSWTEGTNSNFVLERFSRSLSLDYNCQPCISHEERKIPIGFPLGCRKTSGSSSSSCSEVDWSWLEEVECLRGGEDWEGSKEGREDSPPSLVLPPPPPPPPPQPPPPPPPPLPLTSVEEVGATAATTTGQAIPLQTSAVPTPTRIERRLREVSPSQLDFSVAMSVGQTTAKSSRWSPGDHEETTASSWVRASMRRLRHLRLPEAVNNNRQESANQRVALTSAPNSLPDIALIAPEILAAQTNGTSVSLRPSSAPVRQTGSGQGTPRRGRQTSRNRQNRNHEESRQSSLVSSTTVSDTTATSGTNTTCSSSFAAPSNSPNSSNPASPRRNYRRTCERQRDVERNNEERGEDDDEDENPLGRWPHALSPALACLGCTLGLFNISRFAILSIQFGANFIVQFLILSLVIGVPLFTLQVCLGQRLSAGTVDMWKISPLFQGVGIALLAAQAFIGIYSIVGISWMFVYFRDSFITKQDRYRWAEPFLLYRDDTRPSQNASNPYKLYETVPDYFSGAVLQRHHLNEPDPGVITLKFQVAFNLAVVWMIVFVSLSKGLRSYGKVVYVFTLVPVFGTLVLCTKLLGLTPPGSIHQLFPATVWNEFFLNSRSWVAASTEVFLTWGLLGAAAMQIAAHNKHKHLLQRDTSLVVVLTFAVLLLAAFLANTCAQILRHHGYIYVTSSFERISGYTFLRPINQPAPSGYSNTPDRFMSHASFLMGQRVTRPGSDPSMESGYQVLRLATELVPATLALLGTEQVSPFWAVLFYFILILFGIAQQLAIWHCVITGIMAINTKMMKLWETTITFFSCACAYILGLPMATELGIYVVYYLDYTIGGAWWIMVLYLVQVGAVFAVRGRPHTGEAVVAELFPPTGRCLRHWAGPLLSFTWNVILPVTLMVLTITIFKSSGFRELYTYRRTSRDYWAIWARQLGASIQLIPILIIPAVAVIQTCRYLNSGPPDIFDRIQLLYRPTLEPQDPQQTQIDEGNGSVHGNGVLPAATEVPFEDPPPKYTPPPSYTTATGARIAKMLRQSFRRSVRRIANVLGEGSTTRQRPALQPPPPDYDAVLVEMDQGIRARADITLNITDIRPELVGTRNSSDTVTEMRRPSTIDRTTRISTVDRIMIERTHSTLERGQQQQQQRGSGMISGSNLSPSDVANLLRSSIRRGTARTQATLRRSFGQEEPAVAASVENLVEAAAPIGQESLVLPNIVALVPSELPNDNAAEKKTADETYDSVSVI